MENPQSSVLVDPLADFSLVSLFPRTFNQHDFDPDPNPRYNDPLEAFGAQLESMALKNHNRLLEQAKSILDGGLESLNIDNLENVGSQDSVGDVPGVNNGNLQGDTKNLKHARDENTVDDLHGGNQENLKGRRPGMGRKKARFSMKPNPSQPREFEPYVDMDKLSDPVEFFAALEKQENAKNEWNRLSGKALMDLDQNVPLRGERRRRPGLLGKSATYRHRYSMAPSVDDKTFLSSQETLSQDLCSPTPSDHRLQPEHSAQIPLSPTKEWAGRANAGKEKSNDIRDELPLGEDKDDESDEIIQKLHQRFMPMEIGKSCLPELDSVLRSELLSIGDYLLGPQDNMSDLHDIVSAIGKETTLRCDNVKRSSGHTSTSPRPPKSPYSSISLLKAHLFHSRKEKDPFLALDIDVSPLAKATSGQDAQDLAAKPSEKSVKDSVKMQNTSSVGAVNIESGSTTNGVDDTSETNMNSPVHNSECNVVTKDIQDLAALKFTSSESNKNNSMVPGDSSDFIEHTMLDDGPVEHGEMDIDPKSSLHEKGSDATNTMETAKGISKTLGVNSDGLRQDVLDHAFRRDQIPKPAESNVVHTEDVCGFDAPCQKTTRDNSIVSGIAMNTSPHIELDHDVMANKKRDGVLEDNPSDVFDDAGISANKLIEPDVRVEDKDVQGCNMEKSNYNKEQSTVNAIENLEKHGSSSDRYKLFTAGAGGDLDHDRPSSSSARPLKKTLKASSKMAEKKKSKARGAAHEHPPATMSAAECTRSKASEAAHEYPPAKTRAAATRKPTRESIFCTRNILAGCGTQWETGVRRSTRIRSRPLEYWKGERQLFGRIHDGLITVVGAKYFSPEKEAGKVVLKVKSYVSDEYKEMVEWAAL